MSNTKEKMLKGLKELVRNEIRVEIAKPNAPLPVCACRVGGKPAVPADFVWPEASYKRVVSSLLGPLSFLFREKSRHEVVTTQPLAFLAQFNLKDVAPLDKENLLPQTGVLSFFYDLQEVPEHEGSARVFYFPDESILELADFPDELQEDYIVPEYAINLKEHVSLPDWEDFKFDGQDDEDDDDGEDDDNYEVYEECRRELDNEEDDYITGELLGKLLGYPDLVQGSMMDEEWTLLFQLDSRLDRDSDFELYFGDLGAIYYWIKKEDLKNCVFDKTWLELQYF